MEKNEKLSTQSKTALFLIQLLVLLIKNTYLVNEMQKSPLLLLLGNRFKICVKL